MERETAKKLLAAHGWLSRLPEPARSAVLERSVLKKFAKGEQIYRLEDPPGGMNGLVSGTIAVSIAAGNAPPHFIHCGRLGFWFGEAAVITGEPRRVGVAARSDVTVLHVSLSALNELIAASPTFWRHLALNAALNLDVAFRAYSDLRIRDPYVRIASVLFRLGGDQLAGQVSREPCRIDLNQTDLAEITGLSRVVVSRVLSRLSQEQMVQVGYGFLELRDMPGLGRIAVES